MMNMSFDLSVDHGRKMSLHLSRWIAGGIACVLGLSLFPASGATRGYSGTQIFSTVGGDKDEGEPNHCGEPGGASSWFFYQAPRSGVLIVDTKGSSFDTVLAVYIGPGTDYVTLTNVACNNDSGPGVTWSRVVFNVTSNTMYYMAVDGVGGVSGTVKLNYQLNDPILITNQPQSLVRATGSSASFSVGVTGSAPLGYQWLFYGAPINGATQSVFTVQSVQPAYEGAYSVMVQNQATSVQSAAAALTVCAQLPVTNSVGVSSLVMNGTRYLRVVGHAAAGSVLESSEDLHVWTPLSTNGSSQGLFTLDETMDRPQRYFRLRLSP
ncbi:MAG: hypothetical protein QOF48_2215 [Verrucomicrobiota bacterium]|jgi:hypothetical protein